MMSGCPASVEQIKQLNVKIKTESIIIENSDSLLPAWLNYRDGPPDLLLFHKKCLDKDHRVLSIPIHPWCSALNMNQSGVGGWHGAAQKSVPKHRYVQRYSAGLDAFILSSNSNAN